MRCSNCYADIKDGVSQCPNCGAYLTTTTQQQGYTPPPPLQQNGNNSGNYEAPVWSDGQSNNFQGAEQGSQDWGNNTQNPNFDKPPKNKSTLVIVLVVVGLVLCCCCLPSVSSLALSFLDTKDTVVESLYDYDIDDYTTNDYEDYDAEYGVGVDNYADVYTEEDLDDSLSSYYESDEYTEEAVQVSDVAGDYSNIYTDFYLDGVLISLPCKVEEFDNLGFYLEDPNNILNAGYSTGESVINFDSERITLSLFNISDEMITYSEAGVDYVAFSDYYFENGIDLVFGDGFTLGSSYEDIAAYYGTPSYEYSDNTYDWSSYEWQDGDDFYTSIDCIFEEDKLTDITFNSYYE